MSGPLTRIIILVKAVRAGGVLAAYLIAPPPVLVELGGPPWMLVPRAFKFAELGDAFMSGYQLLLLGTWLLWGGVVFQAVAAVRDIQRELRHADAVLASGRWGRRPGVRNLIASLILAPLSAPVPAMASTHGTTVMLAPVDPTAGTVQGDAADAQAEPRQAAPTHQEVRVQAWGSTATLWGLAEEHLGEGTRWREIWALNEGRQQADGTVMRSPGLLVPGWTVLVPEPSGEATAEPLRYSIEEGDRLGDIAVRFLGDFDDHRRLQQLNADLISDPDHIEAGDTIILPAGTRDAGKTDHAHGKVRNFGRKATSDDDQNPEPPSPVEPADTTEPTVPPTASPQPNANPLPANEDDNEHENIPSWAVPAAAATAAGLLAVQIGRRRRRRARDNSSATEAQPDDEYMDDEEALEFGNLDEELDGRGYSDAAVDRARLLIHQSAAQLRQRTQTQEPHVVEAFWQRERPLVVTRGAWARSLSEGVTPEIEDEVEQGISDETLRSPAVEPATPAARAPKPPGIKEKELNGSAVARPEVAIPPHAPSGTSDSDGIGLPTVRVKLFGDPAVLDLHGNRVAGLRRNAMRVLLYLGLNPNGARVSELSELFWADISLSKAGGRLSTEIASLRRTVRIALGDSENLQINAVTNINGTYQLAGFVETDVQAFERALKTAVKYPKQSHERETFLRKAIDLHTGRLADRPNIDDAWLDPHRRRLNRTGAQARVLLVDAIHDVDPERSRLLLRDAGRLDPTDRDIQAQVAQAQVRHGL